MHYVAILNKLIREISLESKQNVAMKWNVSKGIREKKTKIQSIRIIQRMT